MSTGTTTGTTGTGTGYGATMGYGGASPAGSTKTYQTPDNFSNEVVTVMQQIKRLTSMRTMQEHFDALNGLDDHVVWDGPVIYTEDRDKVRVLEYFGKLFATAKLDPQLVAIGTSPRGRVVLEAFVNYMLMPRRNLLLWWNYLLPRVFQMGMDWDMELNERDKISRVRTRFHNWPTLPAFMRQLGTWMVAQPLLWTEPIWSQMLHFMGDYTYQREWERNQAFGYESAGFGKEGYKVGYGSSGMGAGYGETTGMTGTGGYGGTTGTTGYGGTTGTTGYGGTTGTTGYGGTTGATTGTKGTTGTTGTKGTTATAGTY